MYNTLDLDKIDRELLHKIVGKLGACRAVRKIEVLDTPKGYHIKFWCVDECDTCRFVFDDQKRLDFDFNRPKCLQNVLFKPYSAHKPQRIIP